MKLIDLATVVLGVSVLCVAHYFPESAGLLYGAGGTLLGAGLPQISRLAPRRPGRPEDAGCVPLGFLFIAVVFLGLAFLGAVAKADVNDPSLGKVVSYEADGKTPKLVAHPSAILPAIAVDLKTSTMAAGVDVVPVGLCYGLTYRPTQWYASGVDACLQVRLAPSVPNQLGFALMGNVLDFTSVGIGTMASQVDGRLVWHGMLYISPRLPIQ